MNTEPSNTVQVFNAKEVQSQVQKRKRTTKPGNKNTNMFNKMVYFYISEFRINWTAGVSLENFRTGNCWWHNGSASLSHNASGSQWNQSIAHLAPVILFNCNVACFSFSFYEGFNGGKIKISNNNIWYSSDCGKNVRWILWRSWIPCL